MRERDLLGGRGRATRTGGTMLHPARAVVRGPYLAAALIALLLAAPSLAGTSHRSGPSASVPLVPSAGASTLAGLQPAGRTLVDSHPFDCARERPADLIPLRPHERDVNLACSALQLAQVATPTAVLAAPRVPSETPPGFLIYTMSISNDAVDGYVVLLGETLSGPQTWTFSGGNWTEQFPSSSPQACVGSSMAYDQWDQYVLYVAGGNCTTPGETWTYHAGTWTKLSPSNSPSTREGAAFTNDSSDGYMLFFGGANRTCNGACGDTWAFRAGNWSQLAPMGSTPSNRSGAGMTYDAVDGYVLLFGGSSSYFSCLYGLYSYCMDNDTWSFHNGNWTKLVPAGAVPPEPYDDGLVYDAGRQTAFYTVADDNNSWSDPEIYWSFAGGNWTNLHQSSTAFGCGSTEPCTRLAEALAYDWKDGYDVMFGGVVPNWRSLSDTWIFDHGNWTNLTGPVPVSVSAFTATPENVSLGETVTFRVTAGGGMPPYAYAYLSLPPGCATADVAVLVCAPTAEGTYNVTVIVADSLNANASSSVSVSVLPLLGYPVSFVASGLPDSAMWNVTVNGVTSASITDWINLTLANGTYGFWVGPPAGYTSAPTSGVVVVNGIAETLPVAFAPTSPATYRLTFVSHGLGPGAIWNVSVGTLAAAGAGGSIAFYLPPATYAFRVAAPAGYTSVPSGGVVNLTANTTIDVQFYGLQPPPPTTFRLTVHESGLASGTVWTVNVGGEVFGSNSWNVSTWLANGSYTFSINPVPGYAASGVPPLVTIDGAPATYGVTFAGSGGNATGATASQGPGWMYVYAGVGLGLLLGGAIVVTVFALRGRRGRTGAGP